MTGLVLLAAGASARLGKPKQNLIYEDKTLLQHAIQAALGSVCEPTVVVLGAQAEKIKAQIESEPIEIIQNPDWSTGMASSIHCGLLHLLQVAPEITSVIFLLCDQPFVEAALLNELVQTQSETGKEIVACAYQDTLGTPALFDKIYFPELLSLTGDEGAKKLIFKHKEAVASLPFPQGVIDIDTPADYENLQHNN